MIDFFFYLILEFTRNLLIYSVLICYFLAGISFGILENKTKTKSITCGLSHGRRCCFWEIDERRMSVNKKLKNMITSILVVAGLACFGLLYKAIDFFEKM